MTIVLCVALSAASGLVACAANPSDSQSVQPTVIARPTEQPGKKLIRARAVSLDEMIVEADRIFVGQVTSVEQLPKSSPATGVVQTRVVRIRLERVLKGQMRVAEIIDVHQTLSGSSPVAVGERVMWYLWPDSSLGLTQPVGIYSGDFRVVDGPNGPVVTNLRANEGLWRGRLDADDGFDRANVMRQARGLGLPNARLKSLEASSQRGSDTQKELPLELLVSATLTKVQPQP